MDDQMIETLLRDGDETAPAELREAIRGLVGDEPIVAVVSERGRDPRRIIVGVAAAAAVVLAIGAIVAVGQRRDTTTITDTVVPTNTDDTPATTPLTTTPSSTTPSAASVRADRFDDLPATDPITVTPRPGVLWPLVAEPARSSLKGFMATEEQRDGETIRTIVYVRDRCDVLESDGRADVPGCEPAVIVQARFGASPTSAPTMATIPLSNVDDIWKLELTDPAEIPLCPDAADCDASGAVTLMRRIGDVPVTITGNHAAVSLVEVARNVVLVDELEVPSEMPWFRDTLFGPVVAVTDDGEHELRAQSDGDDIAVYTARLDTAQTLPTDDSANNSGGTAPAGSPIRFSWHYDKGTAIVFGITDPEVFEIVFEAADVERSVTATGDLSGMFRSQFFIAALPWRPDLTGREQLTVSARDVNGIEIACLNADGPSGVQWVGETCSPVSPVPTDDLEKTSRS